MASEDEVKLGMLVEDEDEGEGRLLCNEEDKSCSPW